jgi:hypothetical protein
LGTFILTGSSLALLFMSSLKHKSKAVGQVFLFLFRESYTQHIFRKLLLGPYIVLGAGNITVNP